MGHKKDLIESFLLVIRSKEELSLLAEEKKNVLSYWAGVKVPNWIECALSQSTSLCGLNPVTSGLEWNVGGRSLRHMTSVHRCSRMTSVRGT